MAGNFVRTRAHRAPSLSRRIVDLDRAYLDLHRCHDRREDSRPRHHVRLFRSRQQNLELFCSYRARFVTSRGVDRALHLQAPTRKLVLTARFESIYQDIVCLPRGEGVFHWDHIRAVHMRNLVAMQEHPTIHEVRRVRFTVTGDV